MRSPLLEIWDAHAHPNYRPPPKTPENICCEVLMEMDRCGVAIAVISPANWGSNLTNQDYSGANEEIAKSIRNYPNRFIGFARVSPRFPGAIEEFERSLEELGLKGLKLHPLMDNFYPDNKVYFELYEKASKFGVPILFHTDPPIEGPEQSTPWRILRVAENFPHLTIILAHVLGHGDTNYTKSVIMDAASFSNVYFETSFLSEVKRLELAVDMVGVYRLLFASDFPWGKMDETLRPILDSNFGEKDKKAILHGNLRRLLKGG